MPIRGRDCFESLLSRGSLLAAVIATAVPEIVRRVIVDVRLFVSGCKIYQNRVVSQASILALTALMSANRIVVRAIRAAPDVPPAVGSRPFSATYRVLPALRAIDAAQRRAIARRLRAIAHKIAIRLIDDLIIRFPPAGSLISCGQSRQQQRENQRGEHVRAILPDVVVCTRRKRNRDTMRGEKSSQNREPQLNDYGAYIRLLLMPMTAASDEAGTLHRWQRSSLRPRPGWC